MGFAALGPLATKRIKVCPQVMVCRRCNEVPPCLEGLQPGDPLPKGVQVVGRQEDQIRCPDCNSAGTKLVGLGLSLAAATAGFSPQEEKDFWKACAGLKTAGAIKRELDSRRTRSAATIQEKISSGKYKPKLFWENQGYVGVERCADVIEDSMWGTLYCIDELSKVTREVEEDRSTHELKASGKPKAVAKPNRASGKAKPTAVPKASTPVAEWLPEQHEPYKQMKAEAVKNRVEEMSQVQRSKDFIEFCPKRLHEVGQKHLANTPVAELSKEGQLSQESVDAAEQWLREAKQFETDVNRVCRAMAKTTWTSSASSAASGISEPTPPETPTHAAASASMAEASQTGEKPQKKVQQPRRKIGKQ